MADNAAPPAPSATRAPKPHESRFSSFLVAAGITASIAVLIPITQAISASADRELRQLDSVVNPPPPPPPPAPPPPPEDQQEEDEPEIKEERPPISLDQLELALNADLSGLSGDISIPTFDVSDDLAEMIFDITDVDERPEPIFRTNPTHPPELKRRNMGGQVVVTAVIDREGNVRNVVIESSTNQAFEPPTLNAFRKWKFRPARKGGEPVNVRIRQPLTFPGRQ